MLHVTTNIGLSSKDTVLLPSSALHLAIKQLHMNCQQKVKSLKSALLVTIFLQCSLVLNNCVIVALWDSSHDVIIC